MIGKKEWFKPRFLGWGLRPVTWEGFVYIAVAVLLFTAALNLPFQAITRVIIAGTIMAIFLTDTLVIMFGMYASLDEREKKHQQIAETTVAYVAVIAVIVALLYKSFVENVVDTWLIAILVVMALSKAVVSLYLWKNG